MEQRITAPKGCKIDSVEHDNNSVVIMFSEDKEQEVRTWDDLIGTRRPKTQVWVGNSDSNINSDEEEDIFIGESNRFEFIDAKHAKSALAMAQISQLIPYFGGAITDEEWEDQNAIKYIIERLSNRIITSYSLQIYHFLAFHTGEQRTNFFKYNERLVKEYLMLD